MSRTATEPGPAPRGDGPALPQDWDEVFPPDPELMASAEGDTKGLAELKQTARQRIQGSKNA